VPTTDRTTAASSRTVAAPASALTRVIRVLPMVGAAVLVPWTVGIATLLPHSAVARHWNLVWAGLDVAITAGLAMTTRLAVGRDHRAALAATATATLMCADVWFDLCTSAAGAAFTGAAGSAAAELVVAGACLRVGLGRPGGRRPIVAAGSTTCPRPGTTRRHWSWRWQASRCRTRCSP
jgi:hypothetical protein